MTREAFAPFGDVIETAGSDYFMINNGSTRRYHKLATVETAQPEDNAIISIFSAEAGNAVAHPHAGTPSAGQPGLHPAARQPPGRGRGDITCTGPRPRLPDQRKAGRQLPPGVWHHPVLTIERDDFLVVDRSGSGNNCDEHFFTEDEQLLLDPNQTNKRSCRRSAGQGRRYKTVEAHLIEWLNLLVRWIHMIVGIAWIGASFYFVWLENNLSRSNPREGLSGDLWAIHGGGIYHLEVQAGSAENAGEPALVQMGGLLHLDVRGGVADHRVLPEPDPLPDRPGSDLAPAAPSPSVSVRWSAAGSSTPSSAIRRARPPALLGLVLFVLLCRRLRPDPGVQRPRAYLHVGAIIGTIMVGNVFRVIMPAQRALVKAIEETASPIRCCRPRACCAPGTTTTSPCRCCSS